MNLQSIKQRFGIIGSSKLLDRALSTAVRVASTDLAVLIMGESGVGKEVFSKIIHNLSARKHNKFIAINCGAIPEGTINSELFGHDKGAFTGATSERKGYFETVNGGTIFLDEIGEMPLDTQSHLLRILESGEFIRVGSSKVLTTDVRVIAATNVKLETSMQKGKFREDLYYRLSTVPIQVPALRERREDIPLLFRKFAVDFAEKQHSETIRLEEDARVLLMNYLWPGNIRELKNVAEQISVLATTSRITAETFLEFVPNAGKRNLPALATNKGNDSNSFQEREILYKLLFEMKHDMNDLKSLVFELIQNNNLRVPNTPRLQNISNYVNTDTSFENAEHFFNNRNNPVEHDVMPKPSASTPILIKTKEDYNTTMEEVDESLSLEEMETRLIKKALQKHNNKRKYAAIDLGISERTLYRKIKQYKIDDFLK